MSEKQDLDLNSSSDFDMEEEKISLFSKNKIILAVLVMFAFVQCGTVFVLYFTNAKAKTIVDRQIKSYKTQKEIKEKAKQDLVISDPRISQLAKYYLDMTDLNASNKMLDIKKTDKKAYEKIMSSMRVMNPDKTAKIKSMIKTLESKTDVIKQEYEEMEQAKAKENSDIGKYYGTLGIKGSIDAIQKELQSTMNYDKVASALQSLDIPTIAKILHYINPMYVDGIRSRFSNEFNKSVDRELQNYSEFLRKNASIGRLYDNMEEKLAAEKLQNQKEFSTDQLATIFSNMDYLQAAKILNEFEDEEKVKDVLETIKDIEDYQMNFDGSFSTVVANSLKVLKKYKEDVDILRNAYQKMQATDLADIIDKLITANPVYRSYKIDNTREFSITEKQMAIDALKKLKPALVGQLLSELKNNNKVDKAAYISREIGIPDNVN